MSDQSDQGLAELPGFGSLAPPLQALLRAAEGGDESVRPRLLTGVADVLNVFIALDLLQYVFMPADDEVAAPGPISIDLLAPDEADSAAIAWFSIDEAGYDEFRDAVTLFGDIADVLNPPIVLDAGSDDEALKPED